MKINFTTPTYDGLNRRISTTSVLVTNGVALSTATTTINAYYDPQVVFLELGVNYGSSTEWKLYGPDLHGVYGGMNGVGGLDAVSPILNLFQPTVSDFRGNILGVITNGMMSWNPARPTGYGAVPGYQPLPLANGANIALASAWRGRWADITGLYNIGLRPYEATSGRWLTFDSVWNEIDPNGMSFSGGDPINSMDSDGRLSAQSALNTLGQDNSMKSSLDWGIGPAAPTFDQLFNAQGILISTGLPGQSDNSGGLTWSQPNTGPYLSQGNPNAQAYSPPPQAAIDGLVLGSDLNLNSPEAYHIAGGNSILYVGFSCGPQAVGNENALTYVAASEPGIITVQSSSIITVDWNIANDGMIAARNAAMDNLNSAQRLADQATDLVEGAMEAVNNAGQVGLNSAQMAQANQSLLSALQLQVNALQNLNNARNQWDFANWLRKQERISTLKLLVHKNIYPMTNDSKILIEEHNVISLRRASVIDSAGSVALIMLPAESSMAPKLNVYKTGFEKWLNAYIISLYQHTPSGSSMPLWDVKELVFEKPPELKLLWTDSGNSVAVYLNGEPWAFIDEHTQKAYSKGILVFSLGKAWYPVRTSGNPWNQEVFENTFKSCI